MKSKLFIFIAAVLAVMVVGLVTAQEPNTPAAVIEKLVSDGYWPDGTGSEVAESRFKLVMASDATNKLQWDWTLGEDDHRDFVLGTTVVWSITPAEDSCGVVFRQADNENFYVVYFNRNGVLRFAEMENGNWLESTDVELATVGIDSDGDDLWLVAQEGVFEVFINGEHAAQFTDDTLATGKVGLALNVKSGSMSSCSFTNSWLWEKAQSGGGLFGGSPKPTAIPRPTATPSPAAVTTLVDYNKPMNEAVAELERLGIIPAGGNEVFREPYAYFEGTGSWFTRLAAYRPHTHVVVAGTLTFFQSDTAEMEMCTLLSRIIDTQDPVTTYLQVGFASGGYLMAFDFVDGERYAFAMAPESVDLDGPHHVLYTAFRDKLNVFVDGQRVITDLTIHERAGTYGIALLGREDNARCEGRDLWVWEVDDAVTFGDQCGIRVANTANLRGGPGTEFDKTGTLEAGQTVIIVGQATGSDGFTWWKLESGDWVRSDVVTAGGNCAAVPEVEP